MLPSDPTLERTFKGHRGAVTSLAFNSSMSQLASGGQDNEVMVWNFKPKVRAFRYAGHTVSARRLC
jgi:centriolar protein POC1